MSADLIPLLLATIAGFVSTNLDNLLMLVTLAGAGRRMAVAMGFLAAAVVVLGLCAAASALGRLLDPGFAGYLGVIPLAMGCYLALKLLRGESGVTATAAVAPVGGGATFFLMLSNSSDSLALFLPLLADTHSSQALIVFGGYLVMALLWIVLARWLTSHRVLAEALERHGRWLVPGVMVVVGSYILLDTPYDRL